MPRQLGPRFALEAAFLILVAVGAGLLDLRPVWIVVVMAVAWLLVALMEYAASREAPAYAVRPGPLGPIPEGPSVEEEVVEERPSPTLLEPEAAVVEAPPAPSEETLTQIAPRPTEPAPAEKPPAAPEGEAEVPLEPEVREEPVESAAEPTTFAEEPPRARYRLDPLQPRPKRRRFWQRGGRGDQPSGSESSDGS
jgi:hypothetical protein